MRPSRERLARRTEVNPQTGCHEWTGAAFRNGYGTIYAAGKSLGTHRVAWELANGPIPDGLFVLHRCDNRLCVNPGHLFLGDHADNMADMRSKGRQARGERHGRAKLTVEQVIAIKAILASGALTQRRLAGRFGVSLMAIYRISSGKTWAHVKAPASARTLTRASELIGQHTTKEAVAS